MIIAFNLSKSIFIGYIREWKKALIASGIIYGHQSIAGPGKMLIATAMVLFLQISEHRKTIKKSGYWFKTVAATNKVALEKDIVKILTKQED